MKFNPLKPIKTTFLLIFMVYFILPIAVIDFIIFAITEIMHPELKALRIAAERNTKDFLRSI